MLNICSEKTTDCGLVSKANGSKMHEGVAALHPQLHKIKARSLFGRTTETLQRMTSYLPEVPLFLICYLRRTMWRLNQGKCPHAVSVDPSVACLVRYEENSAEKVGNRSTPLETCPHGKEVQHHHSRSGIPPSELHHPRICRHLLLSGGLRTCCHPH